MRTAFGWVIIWNKFPVGEYRKFFQHATGKERIDVGGRGLETWIFTQSGKTLKEALEERGVDLFQLGIKNTVHNRPTFWELSSYEE